MNTPESKAYLFPRINANGQVVCVSVLNRTVGESEPVTIKIRNPYKEKFYYDSQYNGCGELPFEKKGNDYYVTLPSVHAWSCATIFVGEE